MLPFSTSSTYWVGSVHLFSPRGSMVYLTCINFEIYKKETPHYSQHYLTVPGQSEDHITKSVAVGDVVFHEQHLDYCDVQNLSLI